MSSYAIGGGLCDSAVGEALFCHCLEGLLKLGRLGLSGLEQEMRRYFLLHSHFKIARINQGMESS